ncbi:MAG TPA: hypothetical protein VED84_02650 [Acidimicrobiales bacterium]|nr:hypothetical protein [Acidimicrobiales bacterium]
MVSGTARQRHSCPNRLGRLLEVIAVLASPGIFYFALRLQGMAPTQLPDPSMHTTFIVDPRDIFIRYARVFAPTARMREAARVGFLVPGRIAYLLFGAVGGFFTFRYVLALVAVVPLYVLLSRLYGRWAGWTAIAVVMSSPVFISAWGTDYPDSAAISYLTGGLCALAIPGQARRRSLWLALAAALLTLAVWSHGAAAPLVAAVLLAYAVVRMLRARPQLLRDAAILLVSAVVMTAVLSVGSWLLLGQLNFLTPTWQAARFLATPAQEQIWHSTNWRWVLYDPYLLVPPAALGAFLVLFARRWRRIGTPPLFIGLASTLAFGVAAYLQFVGKVQMLEIHFFSSMLWSAVAVLLALTFAELVAPFVDRGATGRLEGSRAGSLPVEAWGVRAARGAIPALLVVAVALAYEAGPRVPAMKLDPGGWIGFAVGVGAAVFWRARGGSSAHGGHRRGRSGPLRAGVSLIVLAVIAGALLVLTVAPGVTHEHLPGTQLDPRPVYANSLGGSDTLLVDEYQVVSELPGFVGHASYAGEQLLVWWPHYQLQKMIEPIGIFHAGFNSVTGTFPQLSDNGKGKIEYRRPAQILLMSTTGDGFPQATRALAPFDPLVVRRGVLADGVYRLHVWLVDLRLYIRAPR